MVSLCSKLSASRVQFIAINLCSAPKEAYLRMVDALKAVESYLNLVIDEDTDGVHATKPPQFVVGMCIGDPEVYWELNHTSPGLGSAPKQWHGTRG